MCIILFQLLLLADDIALPYVTQWLRFHFPEAERSARKILQTIRDGSSAEQTVDFLNEGVENAFSEYWDTVTGLVLQGNVDLARILLQLHSQFDSDIFSDVDRILRTMPVYNVSKAYYQFSRSYRNDFTFLVSFNKVFGESSLPEFNMQWKLWQTNASRKLQSRSFDQYPQLKFIVQVCQFALILKITSGVYSYSREYVMKEC